MVITYPLMTVVDDSGAVVTGATVGITSVTDKSGSAIPSHGATVSQSGANVSVDYDAEAKGEAWIVLAISKVGSTFTGLNAAPAFYLAKDSGRVLNALPNAAANAANGLMTFGTGTGQVNPASGKIPATIAAADVSGNLAADLQTIKTQAVTAAAPVTFPASIGTSTYAGGDTAGTTILLARVPTFPANFSALDITASTGLVKLDPAQVWAARNQDSVTAPTTADCMQGAWSSIFAEQTTAEGSTDFTIGLPDNSGPAATFALDVAPESGPFARTRP